METDKKACCCADISICQKEDDTGLIITAALPGIHKEDVRLNMKTNSFCLAGERENMKYDCCYDLPCEVDEEKAEAKFDNGLLTVTVPFKETERGRLITVH